MHEHATPGADAAPDVPHMTPEQFREAGERLLGWVARYHERVGSMPVRGPVRPGDLLRALPDAAPEQGEADLWASLPDELDRLITPSLTHWQHPGFFGYFPCNASGPAILGELIMGGLNVNGMLWATSPGATELEVRVLDWMARAFGLPPAFLSPDASPGSAGGGVIQGTASEATLVAMLAARRRAGADAPLAVYASAQAHSSVVKAAMIAGLAASADDRRRVRLIGVDDAFALDPAALEVAMAADIAAGITPALVVATLGTTSSAAIDPVPAIAGVIARHAPRCWLHVDAAYTGVQLLLPECRGEGGPDLAAGLASADSFCVNPHKWLLTNFDCDLFWTSDRAAVTGALSVMPEYLRTARPDDDAAWMPDYRDWQVPLGRRFRALKLWLVVRHYGLSGLRSYLRFHLDLTRRFEAMVRAEPRLEVVAPVASGLVCFRPADAAFPGRDTDAISRAVLDAVNARGRVLLSHTTLPIRAPDGTRPERHVLRLAVGAPSLDASHVRLAWDEVRTALDGAAS